MSPYENQSLEEKLLNRNNFNNRNTEPNEKWTVFLKRVGIIRVVLGVFFGLGLASTILLFSKTSYQSLRDYIRDASATELPESIRTILESVTPEAYSFMRVTLYLLFFSLFLFFIVLGILSLKKKFPRLILTLTFFESLILMGLVSVSFNIIQIVLLLGYSYMTWSSSYFFMRSASKFPNSYRFSVEVLSTLSFSLYLWLLLPNILVFFMVLNVHFSSIFGSSVSGLYSGLFLGSQLCSLVLCILFYLYPKETTQKFLKNLTLIFVIIHLVLTILDSRNQSIPFASFFILGIAFLTFYIDYKGSNKPQ